MKNPQPAHREHSVVPARDQDDCGIYIFKVKEPKPAHRASSSDDDYRAAPALAQPVFSLSRLPSATNGAYPTRMARDINGAALRELRELAGISARALGKQCGVHHTTVTRIELGGARKFARVPDLADKLAAALGVPVEQITLPPDVAP